MTVHGTRDMSVTDIYKKFFMKKGFRRRGQSPNIYFPEYLFQG